MRTRHRYSIVLLAMLAMPLYGQSADSATPAGSTAVFQNEELDQMLAPLALYPDALLAQVLMAATYPGDVADAVTWSTEHPDASGEEAVRQVAEQPWDPSVQSLVAFPALLVTLGQDPAWVQRVGDAFLAQPEAVMDAVQRLRRQAQAAGNLHSNEQQTVTTSSESTSTQTIIIEPADPQVVYVPSYNPSLVYGTWPYPAYPPTYYPPPPGYYLGSALAAGLAFGAGVAIIDSLWGDCDWNNGDIDIDVNRYNNINHNRQINAQQNNWRHDAANRDGVPYRDRASREQYSRRLEGSAQRDELRGRDPSRTTERERARQSLSQRGFEAPATTNRQARERAQTASRDLDRSSPTGQRLTSNPQARQQARQQFSANQGVRNNAFTGARNPAQSRLSSSRGQASQLSASRPRTMQSARPVQRASRAPSRSGGGRRR